MHYQNYKGAAKLVLEQCQSPDEETKNRQAHTLYEYVRTHIVGGSLQEGENKESAPSYLDTHLFIHNPDPPVQKYVPQTYTLLSAI